MIGVTVYTDDNLLAECICKLFHHIHDNVHIMAYQPLKLLRCDGETIIFNLIRSDNNVISTMNFLNRYKVRLSRMKVALIAPNKLRDLCIELALFKVDYLLTEKSPASDYRRCIYQNTTDTTPPQHILSERERMVLTMLLQEYSPSHIAEKLSISYKTVCAHKLNIMRKLQIKNINSLFTDYS
ncbi:response regulator transcription factor [Edwardsiella tarda]|uniref:helix-turn-helix transcriptional regulator n=1 Tax=Edwardsiella tarda TaxID=636 RepID=UPI00351C9E89